MSFDRVTVVPADHLDRDLLVRWESVLQSNASLASPYFRPEFVQAVASVRQDVEVAVLEQGGRPHAFFPFQRGRGRVAYPVGGRYSDFQGLVAPVDFTWSARDLVHASGLAAWKFDHLLGAQEPFRPYHWADAPSPFLDLSSGFDAYRAERRRAGSDEVESILYKSRKASRRIGPIRFELDSTDRGAFESLLRWKSAQLIRTGQADSLSMPWVGKMLDRIRQTRSEGFSGLLSTLHIGDRLAAAHLGMRTKRVLHYWLPAFDPELGPSSPGQICILELARAAADAGISRLDLGKGDEPYKARLMSDAISVATGSVDLRPIAGRAGRLVFQAGRWARTSPLRRPLLGPARWIRRTLSVRRDQ